MLVDHVEQLQPPAVFGLVELVVQRPHMIGMLSGQPIRRAAGGAQPLALAPLGGHAQAFLAPQPLDRLAVHHPVLLAQHGVGAAIAPARMDPAERTELLTERSIPVGLHRLVALGAAVLPDQLARPPLGDPEHPLQVLDGAAPAGAGSPVSPPQLLQGFDLELLVSHDPLEPGVLGLQFLQPLDVLGLQPAVLRSPAVVGRLGDL